jgi:hypothetical protein
MVKLKKGKKGIRAYAKAKQNVTVNVITNKTRRAVAPAGNRQQKIDPMIQALSSRPQFVSLPSVNLSAQQQFTQNVKPYLEEYLKQKTLVDTKPKTLTEIGIQTEVVDQKEEDPIQVSLRREAEEYELRGRSLERSPSGSRPPPFNPERITSSSSSSSSSLDPRIVNFLTKSNDMLEGLNEQIQDPLLSKKERGKLQKQINAIGMDQQFMAKGSQSERDMIFRKNLYKK